MKTREEIVLEHIDRDGLGLEIGPSHGPLASKKAGYRVHVLDHLDQAQLKEKYRPHGVPIENIEPVDFVWDGRPYAELVGKTAVYDWIIASHVIEHTLDLVSFLNDCQSILKPQSVLSLVVPDMRYCFDHFRARSSLAQVIDAAVAKPTFRSPGTAAEFILNAVSKGGRIAWARDWEGEFSLQCGMEQARGTVSQMRNQRSYEDFHQWCFTPTSFRLLLRDLFDLGFIELKELSFHSTLGCEFFVTLAQHGATVEGDRLEMLEQISREQSE